MTHPELRRWSIPLALFAGILVGLILTAHPDFGWTERLRAQVIPVKVGQGTLPADLHQLRSFSRAFVEIAKATQPSVVSIVTRTKETRIEQGNQLPRGFHYFLPPNFQVPGDEGGEEDLAPNVPEEASGSGVIISDEGYIITNNHVVGNADQVKVTLNDKRVLDAKVVGTDSLTDLAVIKINATNLTSANFGNSDSVEIGEWVLAIGSPYEMKQTVTAGIISARGRSQLGLTPYEDFLQTDAAINPGNSGGALINLEGQLIGINTAIFSRTGGSQGIGFAIPVNMVRNVSQALIKDGKVTRGFMGIQIGDLTAEMVDHLDLPNADGALVKGVTKGYPAAKAGILDLDVITSIDGTPIRDQGQLRSIVSLTSPGTTIKVGLFRDGKARMVSVTLVELDKKAVAMNSEIDQEGTPGKESDSGDPAVLVEEFGFDVVKSRVGAKIAGVQVKTVDPYGPAYEGQLEVGDLIVDVNRVKVATVEEFWGEMAKVKAGDTALLHIFRNRRGSKGYDFVAVRRG